MGGEMWRTWGIGRGKKYNEENTKDQTDQDEAEEWAAGCAHKGLTLEEGGHERGKGEGDVRCRSQGPTNAKDKTRTRDDSLDDRANISISFTVT
jgi:hypothetical protein